MDARVGHYIAGRFWVGLLLKTPEEGRRLNLQHTIVRKGLHGNLQAPVKEPRTILDVACGTGIWGREMAQQYPDAQIYNIDIHPDPVLAIKKALEAKGQWPGNFFFAEADITRSLPFDDGFFDVVHARFVSPAIHLDTWPFVISEMVRVTRPGGFIEVVESELPASPGKSYTRITSLVEKMSLHRLGHFNITPHLAGFFQQCGVQTTCKDFVLGTGRTRKLQKDIATDILTGYSGTKRVLVADKLITEEEITQLLAEATQELKRQGITWHLQVCWGQRPA